MVSHEGILAVMHGNQRGRQTGTPKNLRGTTRTSKTGAKKNVLAMSRYRRKIV
jgi:hypothetical protein